MFLHISKIFYLVIASSWFKQFEVSKMQGLGLQSLKKNPALIPLYVCVAAGAVGAVYYMTRLATRNPDVTWNRTSNPEPWQEYKNKQYKFYSPIRDYSKTESAAPKFEE